MPTAAGKALMPELVIQHCSTPGSSVVLDGTQLFDLIDQIQGQPDTGKV